MPKQSSMTEVERDYHSRLAEIKRDYHYGLGDAEHKYHLELSRGEELPSPPAAPSAAFPGKGSLKRAWSGKGAAVVSDVNEADDEASVRPLARSWSGKGAVKAAAAESDDDEASEPGLLFTANSKGLPKRKKPRVDRGPLEKRLLAQLARMRMLYARTSTAVVEMSAQQYQAAVVRMENNIAVLRQLNKKTLEHIDQLAMSDFRPKPLSMRLPVDNIKDLKPHKDSANSDVWHCKACCLPITGRFVQTMTCIRSKMCLDCAMIVIDIVGAKTFFLCVGNIWWVFLRKWLTESAI